MNFISLYNHIIEHFKWPCPLSGLDFQPNKLNEGRFFYLNLIKPFKIIDPVHSNAVLVVPCAANCHWQSAPYFNSGKLILTF